MKLKHLAITLLLMLLCGCGGNGSSNSVGVLTLTATPTGTTVLATATYHNTNAPNPSGVQITFSVQIGNKTYPLGTVSTDSSGIAEKPFIAPEFGGTQTLTVMASTGDLTQFAPFSMTGSTLVITAPTDLTLTTIAATGSVLPFTIPSSSTFITFTDPFINDLGRPFTISASVTSSNPADTFTAPTTISTSTGGTAGFPGASGTLIVPSQTGNGESMTITWTVTDTISGIQTTGTTNIKLTKTS
jgi:hypothetical protein